MDFSTRRFVISGRGCEAATVSRRLDACMNGEGLAMQGARMLRGKTATVVAAMAIAGYSALHPTAGRAAPAMPKPQHVFIIVLENEGYNVTFGPKSPAVYLKHLARQGALLENYYGVGHNSLDNYLAMVSGQAPNPITQADCQDYVDFIQTGTGSDGQALGSNGCVFPPGVSTVVNQLQAKQLTWKGYMEDMGNNPSREKASCGQPVGTSPDSTQHAENGDQYAARHNPFVYFHAIVDDASGCSAHVVNLSALAADLKEERTTPNYAFITPNLCHDGHDPTGREQACIDGQPGGLVSADKFLAQTVPIILASPAFTQGGLLIVTFDEADIDYGTDLDDRKRHAHRRRFGLLRRAARRRISGQARPSLAIPIAARASSVPAADGSVRSWCRLISGRARCRSSATITIRCCAVSKISSRSSISAMPDKGICGPSAEMYSPSLAAD